MIFFALLASYFVFVLFLAHGFRKKGHVQSRPLPSTTILVPFRNEEIGIVRTARALIDSISEIVSVKEVIWINDHSTDQSVTCLRDSLSSANFKNWQIINALGSGKKDALETGVKMADTEVVLTIDADVYPQSGWPTHVLTPFTDSKIKMVCGPVHILRESHSLSSLLESIDVLSLVGSAKSLISNNWAVMCNGANMAYRKSAFIEVNGYEGNSELKSGDDVFLLHKMMKHFPKGVTTPDNLDDSGVMSPAQLSWKDLFYQRLRWASKSTHYRTNEAIFTTLFIASVCAAIPIGLILSLFNVEWLIPVLSLFLGKALLDTFLLAYFNREYKRGLPVLALLLQGLIYPFYTLLIAISVPFVKVKWKGR